MSRFIYLLSLLITISFSSASSSSDANAVCNSLYSQYPGQVATSPLGLNVSLDESYAEAIRYWSAANSDDVPACVFLPQSGSDVAAAVQALNNYSSAQWAVKGGGHNSNRGWSSTSGGVLIAMENMATTTLDSQNLAHVGPGSRWGDALSALEPYGRALVGGRLGDVGVGGYTLGGGLSFLSAEYGFAADNVVEYEIVTAAGELTTASASQNPDLFFALKGGGNQFAIVTEYTFASYPIGTVWGGTRTYDIGQRDAMIAAIHNLTSNYYDPKAAVIVTAESTLEDVGNFVLIFFFYNGESPGSILDEFLAIPYLTDDTSDQSYANLLNANSVYSIYGMRYQLRGVTIPNLPGEAGLDLYGYQWDSFFNLSGSDEHSVLDNFVFTTAFQPLPVQICNASKNAPAGNNALGLDAQNGDRMWMEFDTSWLLPTTDTLGEQYMDQLTAPVLQYAQSRYAGMAPTNYQSGDINFLSYNPLFMNDAMYDQQVLQSYGTDNYNTLAATQKKWDPNGFFSRTGGFKFT